VGANTDGRSLTPKARLAADLEGSPGSRPPWLARGSSRCAPTGMGWAAARGWVVLDGGPCFRFRPAGEPASTARRTSGGDLVAYLPWARIRLKAFRRAKSPHGLPGKQPSQKTDRGMLRTPASSSVVMQASGNPRSSFASGRATTIVPRHKVRHRSRVIDGHSAREAFVWSRHRFALGVCCHHVRRDGDRLIEPELLSRLLVRERVKRFNYQH
jgi:hypothetical protein